MQVKNSKAGYYRRLDELPAMVDASSEELLSEGLRWRLTEIIDDILGEYDSLPLASYRGKNHFVIDEARCCDCGDLVGDIKKLLSMAKPKAQ